MTIMIAHTEHVWAPQAGDVQAAAQAAAALIVGLQEVSRRWSGGGGDLGTVLCRSTQGVALLLSEPTTSTGGAVSTVGAEASACTLWTDVAEDGAWRWSSPAAPGTPFPLAGRAPGDHVVLAAGGRLVVYAIAPGAHGGACDYRPAALAQPWGWEHFTRHHQLVGAIVLPSGHEPARAQRLSAAVVRAAVVACPPRWCPTTTQAPEHRPVR